MGCLIGLDIGTSAVKGTLLDETGKILHITDKKFTYYFENNKKLLDPDLFLKTCFSAIKELTSTLDRKSEVLAICSCCASGNLILLDESSCPVTPIIGWQTKVPDLDFNSFFSQEEQHEFYRRVGWPISGSFPAAYLSWIKTHRPELIDRTEIVTMSAEYLNYVLTGSWGISVSMGTPSFLMDQEKKSYHLPLLERLGIANKNLPPIFDKGTVIGTVKSEIARQLDLTENTKIVLGSFDHPSGALGSGVFDEGQMLLSCGTSWVEFFPVSSRKFALSTGGLVDCFMLDGAPYCVMKSLTSVSEKIDARREHYFGKITHTEFDRLAEKSSLGCNGVTFDFTDDDFEKYPNASSCDIARAIIEGAAKMLKDNLNSLRKCGLIADQITMIGGITNSAVCVNIVSEILGIPISVVNGQSAGAVGAALLAGIGVGVFQNEKQAFMSMISYQNQ